jgi:hypothetical protein
MGLVLKTGIWLVVTVVGLSPLGEREGFAINQGSSADPYVIRAGDKARTPIGLIYSPELLASLLAKGSEGAGSAAIVDAVRQQTPVVVMWSAPVSPEMVPPPTPPRKIAIFPSGNRFGIDRIEPLWLAHDANQLAQLDPRVRPAHVGAVAAFPRDAVVAGRRICLYFELPLDETKRFRSVDRCANLE